MMAGLECDNPVSAGATPLALSWIRYYAGWADKIEGGSSEPFGTHGFACAKHEPYGVIGAIIPWNSPIAGICMKVVPALAAGNAGILKPPTQTPFVAIRFGDDDDDVVAKANDTRFGLGAYLHTRDLTRAHVAAGQLQAGCVAVNHMLPMAPNQPFGRYKQSGFWARGCARRPRRVPAGQAGGCALMTPYQQRLTRSRNAICREDDL